MKASALILVFCVSLSMPPQAAARQSANAEETIKAEDLPVSLQRIKRKLRTVPASKKDGLRLEYYIEVYGRAPRLDLFSNFDLHNGPVPYGGPTHRDVLNLITPQEFRAPAADLSALIKWFVDRGKKKN